MAIEAGLEPLADLLLGDPMKDPEAGGRPPSSMPSRGSPTARPPRRRPLHPDGALRRAGRSPLRSCGTTCGRTPPACPRGGRQGAGRAKFKDYFEHDEPCTSDASHRAGHAAGRNEGMLNLALVTGEDEGASPAKGSSPTTSAQPAEPPGRQVAAGGGELDLEDQAVLQMEPS